MSIFREDIVALVPHLRAFARSLTGGNRDLADDLVQDTLVNAMKAQGQFTPGTNLRAWLFTILRNRFRSLITRRHVTAEVAVDDLENRWWTPATQDAGLEMDAFRRAFACLSPAHREVLLLAVVQELPYEEVARITSCEVGTVKSRVNRARAQLKRMLLEGELPVERSRVPAHRAEVRLPETPRAVPVVRLRPPSASRGALQ
jgi:RNA polymerase sigma-70 factor (ECF subfamily)